MLIYPVSENTASGEVKNCYTAIKKGLGGQTLPVFFTYLGAFPEYLFYITDQLVKNLQNPTFINLVSDLQRDANSNIREQLEKSKETTNWIQTYQYAPSFYYFQTDLKTISMTNTKLACIFVALREAVKGWAIAAKKLTYQEKKFGEEIKDLTSEEDFIFDSNILDKYKNISWDQLAQKYLSPAESKKYLTLKKNYLAKSGTASLEKNLLQEYLKICTVDFKGLMKHDYFWSLRVQLEEKVLTTINNFPHLIYSPYNIIYSLTQKYDNFYELIYILSEQFPTLAMQRLMFSGYMIV